MRGVGTYNALTKSINKSDSLKVSDEINRLLTVVGTSTIKDANTIYALILSVEGGARAKHNIFTSVAFFSNFGVLSGLEKG